MKDNPLIVPKLVKKTIQDMGYDYDKTYIYFLKNMGKLLTKYKKEIENSEQFKLGLRMIVFPIMSRLKLVARN